MVEWQQRIAIDPAVLVGKSVIRGTRLAVEFIIDLLAQGWPESGDPAQLSWVDLTGYSSLPSLRQRHAESRESLPCGGLSYAHLG